jgi:hypothetical protein
MSPPPWVVAPALKLASATVRWLERRLAIRIEADLVRRDRDNPDDYELVIRVFNATSEAERIFAMQLTFTGGAPPIDLSVSTDAIVDRTHNFETAFDEFIISAHESSYGHKFHRPVMFNGVRVRFHSGRDVWRPAKGFRPVTRWYRLRRRILRRV